MNHGILGRAKKLKIGHCAVLAEANRATAKNTVDNQQEIFQHVFAPT